MQNDKSKFKIKVYEIVKRIPRGKILTYKKVAKLAGNPRAWRVVGNALNKSASWRTKIPCHRVIRSDGKIGGYNKRVGGKDSFTKKGRCDNKKIMRNKNFD